MSVVFDSLPAGCGRSYCPFFLGELCSFIYIIYFFWYTNIYDDVASARAFDCTFSSMLTPDLIVASGVVRIVEFTFASLWSVLIWPFLNYDFLYLYVTILFTILFYDDVASVRV